SRSHLRATRCMRERGGTRNRGGIRNAANLDTVTDQACGKRIGASLFVTSDHHSAHRSLQRITHRAATESEEVTHPLCTSPGRCGYRGPRSRIVVTGSVVQREHRAVRPANRTTGAGGLLIGHSNGAVQNRPAHAVSRVELVVSLTTEVRPALTIECRRIRCGVDVPPAEDALMNVLVHGL